MAQCATSLDGGTTFGAAVPIYNLTQCSGIHGHVKVAPDGTAYVPNKSCGGGQGVAVTRDNGLTWTVKTVPGSSAGSWDPSLGIASDGTVYFGYMNGDGHPYIAVSHDEGDTWSQHPGRGNGLRPAEHRLPGRGGRRSEPRGLRLPRHSDRWSRGRRRSHLPGRLAPLRGPHLRRRGDLGDGGRDARRSGPEGHHLLRRHAPAAAPATFSTSWTPRWTPRAGCSWAMPDGCTGGCVTGGPNSGTALATIARQTTGAGLLAAYDSPVSVPAAPALQATEVNGVVHLTWSTPDDHGSPILGYNLYSKNLAGDFEKSASGDASFHSSDDTAPGRRPRPTG